MLALSKALAKRRARKATSVLEFVMILPMFLLLIVFIIDVSRVVMVTNAMGSATSQAARDAAIRGGTDVLCGSQSCFNETLKFAVDNTPGTPDYSKIGVIVRSGERCSELNPNVIISTTYTVPLITPGLYSLLDLTNAPLFNQVEAVGASRCEVRYGS